MYKCEVCNKEFEKIMALTGHKAWHVNRGEKDKIAAKKRGERILRQNIENYMLDPLTCKKCNKIIPYEQYTFKKIHMRRGAKHSFCNSSCAASFNNSNRNLTNKTKKKISESLLKNYSLTQDLRQNNIKKVYAKYTKQELVCSVCSCNFICFKNRIRKTCSNACKNLANSIKRQKFLEKNGNFSTPRETFIYKNVNIEVDSNLEKAGIVHLVDNLNAECIERFKNIINYNDGVSNRTYNPDFICSINNITYIVEVKQKWNRASTHVYNTSIPFKRQALESYCAQKGYRTLWLDFDTTPCLKSVYSKILKERKLPKNDLNIQPSRYI